MLLVLLQIMMYLVIRNVGLNIVISLAKYQVCFKSTSAGTIDAWHYAQKFTSLPTLNATFIQKRHRLSVLQL